MSNFFAAMLERLRSLPVVSAPSMRVVSSEQPGKWDEVQVIAPAAASLLTLTPSGGTPSWES